MKAFVTGASGFIGRYLVRELLSRGHEVAGLVRSNRDVSDLETAGMRRVTGDILDQELMAKAVAGSDVVFHLAAVLTPGDWQSYAQGVTGTENILRAAKGASVGRVVLMSSMSVYAAPAKGTSLVEDSPFKSDGERDFYSRQKVLQEEAAWRSIANQELAITIVRPPIVVGVGDPRLLLTLFAMMESSLRDLADTDRLHLPFVAVTPLAKGLVDSSTAAVAAGNAYNMSHAEPVTRGLFFAALRAAFPEHHSPWKKRLALQGMSLALRSAELALGPFSWKLAARPRAEVVRLLENRSGESASVDWLIDSSKAQLHFRWSDHSDYHQLIDELAASAH
jgi:nucleoside-diphosphate-sugar epimerase